MAPRADNENIIRRVYRSVREQVINYNIPPGERLSIESLADDLRVSTTPVREILNRLAAEDLIVMVPKMGFFMKSLSESEIRDLYELQKLLLTGAVANIRDSSGNGNGYSGESLKEKLLSVTKETRPKAVLAFTDCFFVHLAKQSGNSEIALRVRNICDRLHYVRLIECGVIGTSADQVLHLCELYSQGRYDELIEAIEAYFEYRLDRSMDLCRMFRTSFSHSGELMDNEYVT